MLSDFYRIGSTKAKGGHEMERIWIKNYDYYVPETIRYPRIPLYEILEHACSRYDKNVATVFFDQKMTYGAVSYTHLRAHETRHDLVCRLLLEKKKNDTTKDKRKWIR